jgi:hypothetical protein
MMQPSLEVHVPISPTPTFFHMLQCLALSLREFGGAYRDSPIIVTVGDDVIDTELEKRYPWFDALGIEVRWVSHDLFRRASWFATGIERYRYEYRSDIVLILDADVFICDSFDEMITKVYADQCFAGMIAHYSPFGTQNPKELQIWDSIFSGSGIDMPERSQYYSGEKEAGKYNSCLPYFNFGVQCAPASTMNMIGDVFYSLLTHVDAAMRGELEKHRIFSCQIALTLALAKLDIPCYFLPPRFNFPTDREFEQYYPDEAANIRLLHALGSTLDKRVVFESIDNMKDAAAMKNLNGGNEALRVLLDRVVGSVYAH